MLLLMMTRLLCQMVHGGTFQYRQTGFRANFHIYRADNRGTGWNILQGPLSSPERNSNTSRSNFEGSQTHSPHCILLGNYQRSARYCSLLNDGRSVSKFNRKEKRKHGHDILAGNEEPVFCFEQYIVSARIGRAKRERSGRSTAKYMVKAQSEGRRV